MNPKRSSTCCATCHNKLHFFCTAGCVNSKHPHGAYSYSSHDSARNITGNSELKTNHARYNDGASVLPYKMGVLDRYVAMVQKCNMAELLNDATCVELLNGVNKAIRENDADVSIELE